MAFYPKNAN